MRITIKDVAREAGVSIGTVDRVLNNRQGVSDKTKKKVNDVVERLGYKPSMVAQALVSKGKKIKIGVIYPNVEVQFWDEVVKGIEYSQKRLEPFGVELKVVASKTYSYKEQLELLQYFKKEGVDGIVTMAYHPYRINDMINELYDNGIPVATFISDAPDSKRICFTGLDNFKSGEVAASLMDLYLRGKGKVAIIGIHRDVKCIDDRVRGFVDRIRITDDSIRVVSILNARDHCRDVDMEFRKTVRRMTKIVVNENRDLKGIYVTNSLTSCVGRALNDIGVGAKISVIGHENTNENIEMLKKGIIHGIVYQNQYHQVINSINTMSDYLLKNKLEQEIKLVDIGIKIKENA